MTKIKTFEARVECKPDFNNALVPRGFTLPKTQCINQSGGIVQFLKIPP
jgi:hypothetical protein